jgi:two-component system, chemotaxis family, protein-glutamate methylesterase/glutaminase
MIQHDIFVIGASSGGVAALKRLVAPLPAGLPASLFVVLHIGRHHTNLDLILSSVGALRATQPQHGEAIEKHHIYVAPADYHMRLRDGTIWLDRGPKEHFARPAADPLFRSAAQSYGSRVVGVVLTGGDEDGARGLQAVKDAGGVTVVQDPAEATVPGMPESGLRLDDPDFCVRSEEMPELFMTLCGARSE